MKKSSSYHRLLQFLLALLALIQTAITASAVQYTYNLANNWSDTQNPNGVWSYNYNTSPIGTHQAFWWGQEGWGDIWIGDGCIFKSGEYPTGVTDPWGNVILPPHDWLAGDIMMAALSEPYGGLSTFLNVTWTSPADGTIDISGRAWEGEIFEDRDVAWQLSVAGQVIAQRDSVQGLYRTDTGALFDNNLISGHSLMGIPVAKGQVVEFRVIAKSYYGHFVGVEENITLNVPDPKPLPCGKYTYNLTDNWSDTQNPNGVWSYNYNTSPIGTYQTFWWGQPGWGDIWIGDGCIFKSGEYPTGVTDPWGNVILPPHDWLAGDIMMAALSEPYGGLSTFLNVTWTSPADGTVDITGRAWEGEIFDDRDVAWQLIVGGQVVAQRASVQGLYRTDTGAQFAANLLGGRCLKNIPVTKGEVIEFRVIALSYYGHFVGIEENIALTVPKPKSPKKLNIHRPEHPEHPEHPIGHRGNDKTPPGHNASRSGISRAR